MSENNPYATPKAEITPLNTGEIEFNESKWYSISGRIGRLRYFAYPMWIFFISFILGTLVSIVFALALPALKGSNHMSFVMPVIILIIYLPLIIFGGLIYPIRRLHDLGKTGWLVLIMFIPIVNILFYLYLLFAKGDQEENEYGNPPRPNKWYHWVIGFGIPIVFIIYVTAFILPNYQKYIERAKIQAELNAQSFEQRQQ